MIDRKTFFDGVREQPFGGFLTSSQVSGMNRILDEWERRGLSDPRHLAYMLATVFHETAREMQPIREYGTAAELRAKPYYPWTGRGLVQVTWEVNGRKFGAKVPDDLLSWPVALAALFDGMLTGVFTGRKLIDYFGPGNNDPLGARRIINGTDRAATVASYYRAFLQAIGMPSALVASAPPISSPGAVSTPTQKQGLVARLWTKFTGKAA